MFRSILYVSLLVLILPVSGSDPIPVQKNVVSIGLLVPDSSYSGVIEAAEAAIREANEEGGLNGSPFKLVVRTTEGPWGAGSKESVGLVYEDEVQAIVASLDGRNAHLAEQVAAKSHLVYLETKASDPSLSQAYVPWFIRNVPNDNQQAEAIMEVIGQRGGEKITILSAADYDTRYAVKSLKEQSARILEISPLVIALDPPGTNSDAIIKQVLDAAPDHLVVPFFSDTVLKIVGAVLKFRPHLKVYGTLAFSMGLESRNVDMKSLEGAFLLHSYKGCHKKHGPKPEGLAASYTYDGINLILQAILAVGLEKESIRDHILQQDHPEGITGPVSFDELGNRKGVLSPTN